MNKFQKIGATSAMVALLAAIGAALYEGRQARGARAEEQRLRFEQASLTKEIDYLHAKLGNIETELSVALVENAQLKTNSNEPELLRLRSEVTRLRPLQDDLIAMQKMLKQSSAGLAEWKTNELANVGSASPIDALQSYLYSSRSNPAKIQNNLVGDDVDPPSEEALKDFIKGKIDHPDTDIGEMTVTGYKILSQNWIASDKIRVELQMMAAGGFGLSVLFTLRKIDGEWKLVVFNVRDQQGKVSRLEFVNEIPYR